MARWLGGSGERGFLSLTAYCLWLFSCSVAGEQGAGGWVD